MGNSDNLEAEYLETESAAEEIKAIATVAGRANIAVVFQELGTDEETETEEETEGEEESVELPPSLPLTSLGSILNDSDNDGGSDVSIIYYLLDDTE